MWFNHAFEVRLVENLPHMFDNVIVIGFWLLIAHGDRKRFKLHFLLDYRHAVLSPYYGHFPFGLRSRPTSYPAPKRRTVMVCGVWGVLQALFSSLRRAVRGNT